MICVDCKGSGVFLRAHSAGFARCQTCNGIGEVSKKSSFGDEPYWAKEAPFGIAMAIGTTIGATLGGPVGALLGLTAGVAIDWYRKYKL